MSRLSNDGIDDVESRNFVFRPTLLDELFDALNDVLVVLDGADGTLGDGSHLRLRNGRLDLVERRKLKSHEKHQF